jgi:putative transposase
MTIENKHHRRSIRLPHYDYTDAGAYFVTICTYERVCLFGYVDDEAMTLNTFGRMVWDEWENTAKLREHVKLDRFVVMPNHVHGILWITEDVNQSAEESNNSEQGDNLNNVGARCIAPLQSNVQRKFGPLAPKSIHTIIGTFKAAVTRKINAYRNTRGGIVCQRNYWERVIRTDKDLNWLRFYIDTNPAQWQKDKLYISKSDIMNQI